MMCGKPHPASSHQPGTTESARSPVDSTEYDCQRIDCAFAPESFKHDPDCMFREGPYCLPSGEENSDDQPSHCC